MAYQQRRAGPRHGPGSGRHRLWPHRQKLLRQQHPLRHGEQGPHRRQDYFSSTSSNYNSADGDYLSAAQDYVSSFQDGTRLELQYLDPEGTVIYSSNGLTISGSVPGTGDINQLPAHPDHLRLAGRLPPDRGARHRPSPRPVLYNGKLVGILRYVTSMRLVDRQVIILTLIAVILSVSILIHGLSVQHLLRPLHRRARWQASPSTARRIAGGSYGIQVEKKFDDEIGDLTDAINDMSLKHQAGREV